MTIRLMTMDDYEDVYALWLRCEGLGLNDRDDSAEGVERFLNRNPDTCFVAEEDGKLLAVIMIGYDGRRGIIHHMAVDPARQKQGIGRAILDHALEAVKEKGIAKVYLVAFATNENGNAFWEKVGFGDRPDLVYRDKVLLEFNKL